MLRSSCSRLARRIASNPARSVYAPPSGPRTRLSRSLATITTPPPRELTELDNITTLPNGLRVASEALPDAFSGVGVYVDAGSRYEDENLRGASHLMDRLAFKSTTKRSADAMLETAEKLGGNIQCASSREALMYQAATFNSAVPTAVGLLAETIRDPLLKESEIREQLQTAAYEIGEIWSKPDLILPELLHMAAYKDNTLGNPLLCPEDRLAEIDKGVIESYRKAFYRPERIVVAFAGVSHSEAVKMATQYFGDMGKLEAPIVSSPSPETIDASTANSKPNNSAILHPSTTQQPSKLMSKIPFFKNISTSAPACASVLPTIPLDLHQPARYTGGFLALPPRPPPLNPTTPHFTHIQLAFEGLPIASEDIYALATLQTLLGGGGSFSAGGPGKGMYSRLYTNVLNQHSWVESCVAFNHSYTDSGLFGISASCQPGWAARMLDVMCMELHALTLDTGFSVISRAEVLRAKNQLRSSLLMNLESRMVELEDLGRQVQVHSRKIPVAEMTAKINALTVHDLRRVAHQVLGGLLENAGKGSGAPTVVLQEADLGGRLLDHAPSMDWDHVQDVIAKWNLGR